MTQLPDIILPFRESILDHMDEEELSSLEEAYYSTFITDQPIKDTCYTPRRLDGKLCLNIPFRAFIKGYLHGKPPRKHMTLTIDGVGGIILAIALLLGFIQFCIELYRILK